MSVGLSSMFFVDSGAWRSHDRRTDEQTVGQTDGQYDIRVLKTVMICCVQTQAKTECAADPGGVLVI